MMNKKGQANMVLVGITGVIAAVIGLTIVFGMTGPMTETITPGSGGLPSMAIGTTYIENGTSYTLTYCRTNDAVLVNDLTNATTIAGSDYAFAAGSQTFTLANNASGIAHNGTLAAINYTGYACGAYIGNTTTGLVLRNLPLLMAVAALGLAGGWLFLRGGL